MRSCREPLRNGMNRLVMFHLHFILNLLTQDLALDTDGWESMDFIFGAAK